MRGYNWLMGLVLLGTGWPGLVVGQGVDMEEVRRRAEKYERNAAEAAKKAPAPKPKPKPQMKPKPKPQPAASVPTPAAPSRSSLEPEMVRIPAGCFQMGSPWWSLMDHRDDERQHQVCVQDFEIGQTEVTQAQWQAMMGNNLSHFQGCTDCPVERVSWTDVQGYLAKLNARTGGKYRLPTEAEWEYACRGGVAGQSYCGGDDVDRLAWHGDNSDVKTHPVGQKAANGFGLFDMSGNVLEWTCSLYDGDYGGAEKDCNIKDTSGPRSLRGGSWNTPPAWVLSAKRFRTAPTTGNLTMGFRLARSL